MREEIVGESERKKDWLIFDWLIDCKKKKKKRLIHRVWMISGLRKRTIYWQEGVTLAGSKKKSKIKKGATLVACSKCMDSGRWAYSVLSATRDDHGNPHRRWIAVSGSYLYGQEPKDRKNEMGLTSKGNVSRMNVSGHALCVWTLWKLEQKSN